MDIQHYWEETVAKSTLLPATHYFTLSKHPSRCSLAATATRDKSGQIKGNTRQPLLNLPKSLKTEFRGGLGSCRSYHFCLNSLYSNREEGSFPEASCAKGLYNTFSQFGQDLQFLQMFSSCL